MKPSIYFAIAAIVSIAAGSPAVATAASPESVELLNVSYDPTRELYVDFNEKFAEHWLKETGQTVTVQQSHGGSGSQARAVIDGLQADVVTLALAFDIDAIQQKSQRLSRNWQSRLPDNSAPYTSTIVFLVRKGNPKNIKNWPDLVKEDVSVITPNPKTSGGARWNFLAAWGYVLQQKLGDLNNLATAPAAEVAAAQAAAREYVAELFKHVPVLDKGARGSTNTFVQAGIGDVLLAWENEAQLAIEEIGAGEVEIVYPSISILAEPTVAVVDTVVDRKGTRAVAQAYLEYLYTETGQDIVARHHFRPRNAEVAARYSSDFPQIPLFTIDAVFGGWPKVQAEFFNDGGVFDQIYLPY